MTEKAIDIIINEPTRVREQRRRNDRTNAQPIKQTHEEQHTQKNDRKN